MSSPKEVLSPSDVLQPYHWISISTIGFITMTINLLILRAEIQKRRAISTDSTNTNSSSSANSFSVNKNLRIYSLLCIIFSTIHGLAIFTMYFNGICHIRPLSLCTLALSGACMGFYQLSRLYSCFSRNKVYSDKGYPECLFRIMYIFGICFVIYNVTYQWFFLPSLSDKCGINDKYEYYPRDDPSHCNYGGCSTLSRSAGIGYIIWDFTTLALYISKVYTFRKYKNENTMIYKRIMSILKRILITTLFYELVASFGILMSGIYFIDQRFELNWRWLSIPYFFGLGSTSIALSLSMYLMQQHNTEEYEKFVKYINRYKFICCCCKPLMDELRLTETSKSGTVSTPNMCDDKNTTTNMYRLRTGSGIGGDEGSIETKTRVLDRVKTKHSVWLHAQKSLPTEMMAMNMEDVRDIEHGIVNDHEMKIIALNDNNDISTSSCTPCTDNETP